MKFLRIVFVLIAISGVLAILRIASLKQAKPNQKNLTSNDVHKFVIEDFTFAKWVAESGSSQRKFSLEGKKMYLRSKPFGIVRFAPVKEVLIKEAKVTFFENKQPVSYLSAKKAVPDFPLNSQNYSLGAQNLDFFEDVLLVTNDNRKLTCKRLRLNIENGIIEASGNCILRLKDKTVSADFMRTDDRLTEFETNQITDQEKEDKANEKISYYFSNGFASFS